MSITREWLPWDELCLPQAAARIVDRFAQPAGADECDLRELTCVLPGARAGRLLLAELLQAAAQRGRRLLPPRVLTPGAMVDELLGDCDAVATPVASEIESQWAWVQALRDADAEELQPLLRSPPSHDDLGAWSDFAATLMSLHAELAGELRELTEAADTVERQERVLEGERWRTIDLLRTRQRDALRKAGLVDRHEARGASLQRVIRAAAEGRAPARRLALIGVADLNRLQRAVLNVTSLEVTAFVHAPADHAELFDELGCVMADAWRDRVLDVADDAIVVADRPADMAQAALRAIDALDGKHAANDITVAIGDASIVGDITTAATWAGLHTHDAAGRSLARTAPWKMLEAAADWIEDPRFEHFATLLRHPDFERSAARMAMTADAARQGRDEETDAETSEKTSTPATEDWLSLLDRYFEDHLQSRFTGHWLGDEARQRRLKSLHQAVQTLLQPLQVSRSEVRPIGEWCAAVLEVLANVYGDDAPVSERSRDVAALESLEACFALRHAIEDMHAASPALQPSAVGVTALRMILAHVAAGAIAAASMPGAIEIMGWLELHLDVAPVAIVVGLNDGWIPDAVTSDAFLPDGLRANLGLLSNDRRYARDAYVLEACLRSRRKMSLIVGRRSAQSDPLTPSRLLLACDQQTLVKRVRSFTADLDACALPPPIGLAKPASAKSQFIVPKIPRVVDVPESMSVTAFKTFLNCPYRFALDRLLRLEARDDSAAELDPLGFGDLAHKTLRTLGDDPAVIECDDRQRVFESLDEKLKGIVRTLHGDALLPAMRVQIARLQQRLWSFAAFQAQTAREGWRIRHCEIEFDNEVSLDISGQAALPLRGTIDRIDEHPASGQWRIIDYKTGDRDRSPTQTHHDSAKLPDDWTQADLWTDLQLPLYHMLVTRGRLKLPADRVRMGYIVLPRQSDGARWIEAEWDAAQLRHAIDTAADVVRRLRAREFDVAFMSPDVDSEFDDFARICQTTAFAREDDDDCEVGSTNGGDA